MYSIYKLETSELDNKFLEGIKRQYAGKNIEIIVQDVDDETEYLLSSENNKKHLLKSLKEIKEGKTVTLEMDELK